MSSNCYLHSHSNTAHSRSNTAHSRSLQMAGGKKSEHGHRGRSVGGAEEQTCSEPACICSSTTSLSLLWSHICSSTIICNTLRKYWRGDVVTLFNRNKCISFRLFNRNKCILFGLFNRNKWNFNVIVICYNPNFSCLFIFKFLFLTWSLIFEFGILILF